MIDKPLFVSVVALMSISLIMSYSLSTYAVIYNGYSDMHFFAKQLYAVALGLVVIYALSKLDPDKWFVPIGVAIFLGSFIAMMVMPFLPDSLCRSVLGAKRWIRVGPMSISPVEFFKIGFVFFLSWSFSRKILHHGRLTLLEEGKVVFPYLIVFGIAVILIAVFQKDLGQVVVLAVTLVALFSFAGRSLKLFFLNIFIGLGAFVLLVIIAPHRMSRIKSWWGTVQDHFLGYFPANIAADLRVDAASEPYQISHSLNAIHNGGFFGQGLGNGQFKLGYLSEVHTDFILAGLSEELGIFGLMLVVLIVMFMVFRIFQVASRVSDPTYHLFSIGVGLVIVLAFLVNSYGVSGLIPIKGIAVPFLSYGGSHIFAASVAIGLVLMISKKRVKRRA